MVAPPHVVVVEDEAVTRSLLAGHFASQGYRVSAVNDAGSLRTLIQGDPADLVSLDIHLPDESGIDVLRDLCAQPRLGVMIVTVHDTETDRMTALELGADDYLVKPVNERELVLRARNILRRVNERGFAQPQVLRMGGWSLDTGSRAVERPDGERIVLTRGEFELLLALIERPDRVLSRSELLARITHRGDVPNERTVDVLVGRLRRKIEPDPGRPRHLRTRHGQGYVFRIGD